MVQVKGAELLFSSHVKLNFRSSQTRQVDDCLNEVHISRVCSFVWVVNTFALIAVYIFEKMNRVFTSFLLQSV
jgi:hypothetical protein